MKTTYYILVAFFITSCSMHPSLEYQFGDKEQPISCAVQTNALLNEALYSFEKDIYDYCTIETKTEVLSYGQYIYKGVAGTAPYKEIASYHSLNIRDQLLKENILISNGVNSNLNYDHPAVKCLIDGIEDVALKKTITSLLEINSMDPAMFNSRLRNFGQQAAKNRYQAAYIALDSYYQNLVGLTLETSINE